MTSRLGEWILGPIEWPRVLVGWVGIRGRPQQEEGVVAIATGMAVSLQLLGYVQGPDGLCERWPSYRIRDLLPRMLTTLTPPIS